MASPYEDPDPATASTSDSNRSRKPRTSHACDRCRVLRTKCSGESVCARCIADNTTCVYSDRKRERNKKTQAECWELIDALTAERNQLTKSLRTIAAAYNTRPQQPEVTEIIRQYGESTTLEPLTTTPGSQSTSPTHVRPRLGKGRSKGEGSAPTDTRSSVESGQLDSPIDLRHGGGLAGYVGKTSAVVWMHKVADFQGLKSRDLQSTRLVASSRPRSADDEPAKADAFKYHADEENLLAVDEDLVEPYRIPSKEVALLLRQAFLEATSPTYLFLDDQMFLKKTIQYTETQQVGSLRDLQWLAQANMVWAVGARWLKVQELHNAEIFEDHSIYYARARALGVDHRVRIDHPSLDFVSALGVLTFYLYTNGSISRAFNLSAETIRHAIAHALHLKLSSEKMPRVTLPYRAKLWRSLQTLEILLANLTGRPRSILTVDAETATPDPQTIPDFDTQLSSLDIESNRVWNRFLAMTANNDRSLHMKIQSLQLNLMNQQEWNVQQTTSANISLLHHIDDEIAQSIYALPSLLTWEQTQKSVVQLDDKLQLWRSNLPSVVDWKNQSQNPTELRPKLELAVRYLSLQMSLHRINLCEMTIEDQSQHSRRLDTQSATACISAALELLYTLTNQNCQMFAWQILPWWTMLHPICLAMSCLLLELCFDARHMPNQVSNLLAYLNKSLECLGILAETSVSARRALGLFQILVNNAQQKYPNDPPVNDGR